VQGRGENRSFVQRKQKKANWFCHPLRMNFFLKHIMEGKIMGQENEEEEPSS